MVYVSAPTKAAHSGPASGAQNGIVAEQPPMGCVPLPLLCKEAERLARSRLLKRQRQHLAKLMNAVPPESPFLDMVLDLYVAELESRTLCQSAIESHAPRASAHRHVQVLLEKGLAVRETDLKDLRRKTIRLACHVRASLDRFMDEMTAL